MKNLKYVKKRLRSTIVSIEKLKNNGKTRFRHLNFNTNMISSLVMIDTLATLTKIVKDMDLAVCSLRMDLFTMESGIMTKWRDTACEFSLTETFMKDNCIRTNFTDMEYISVQMVLNMQEIM